MSYGKHEYLTMDRVEDQFQKCLRDHSMRSVSAVVRISREQISARGSLGSYRWVGALFFVVAIVAAIATPLLPESIAESVKMFAMGSAVVTVVIGFGVLATWKDTQRYTSEERALRARTFNVLEELLSAPDLKQKPPDWTEANFLRKLGGRKAGPAVRSWLETAPV
ncbi:hypothetical protein EON79_01450 [bacterium]|nr:MAG: hypothetical protein EON79_01450 [bacterium]